ncbi:MAG: hypothetical protein ACRDZP_09475 [Acidimicrobiales bacterium]
MSRELRYRRFVEIIASSGVAAILDEALPGGGRPRQLGAEAVLLSVMAALDSGRPAQLAAAHDASRDLSASEQVRLGICRSGREGVATYRQLSDTFSLLCSSVDPSPVPSFRGVAEPDRRGHLDAVRRAVPNERLVHLEQLVDDLVEASIPDAYRSASSSLAVDWTDHETWSRPRRREDPQPANDPDASFGHAKRNAPGAKDYLFFGYYAGVATMVNDEGGPVVPELIRRAFLHAPRVDPAAQMASRLRTLGESGVIVGDVLADCGYSSREPVGFARPVRRAGGRLVMDLHPQDRGQKGTFEGALLVNGGCYCPATPGPLLSLGPLPRAASSEDKERHARSCRQLDEYRFAPLTRSDEDGYVRMLCPAVAGKLRCPLRPDSMTASLERTTVLRVPEGIPERCCVQKTISIPPQVNEKTRQAYPYPSEAHAVSYARRTAAERAFASLADPSRGGVRRGWSRLFGLAKNSVMYALMVVVRNVRITESFERRRAEEERRRSGAVRSRERPRRYGRPERDPGEPDPADTG